jgi:protein-tyrosine phosphatase
MWSNEAENSMKSYQFLAGLAVASLSLSTVSAEISGAQVARPGPDTLNVTWSSPNAIDVYESDAASADSSNAHLDVRGSKTGAYTLDHAGLTRRYFILVDERDHQSIRVAERLIPLAQGSNFRDIGGYPAAAGKHVRWGLIYRSGAQPMLNEADLGEVRELRLAQLVDLRSDEERVLAPTRIDGVPYTAVGYSMMQLMPANRTKPIRNGSDLYRRFPERFAPQLKIIFADLLGSRAPIVYNCSAGQDRTGFTTAMILSALGVPRETIYADYLLSTTYRKPEFEMPPIDAAAHPGNPVAQMFAQYHKQPAQPQPLVDAQGRPFLTGAFEEIEAKWGSVDNYLQQEIGLTPSDVTHLRFLYLE